MKTSWLIALLLCGAALAFGAPKHNQTLTLRWQPITADQQTDKYAVSEVDVQAAHKKLKTSLAKVGLDVQLGYISAGTEARDSHVGKLWIGKQSLEQWLGSLDEGVPTDRVSSDSIVKAGLAAASKLLAADEEAESATGLAK